MRFIPTRVHGILDYLGGVLLIAFPFILDFNSQVATILMVAVGVTVLLYSLFTDYELGVSRKIPVVVHLALDGLGGLLLLVSPWLFQFDDINVVWPFVLMGLVELGAAFFTHKVADDKAVATTQHRPSAHTGGYASQGRA
ncbi:MAG: hypothetical protein ACFCVE_15760 [Phycisphaerae bacterium]